MKLPVGFGDQRVVRLLDDLALHLREASLALEAAALEANRSTNRQFRAVADIGFGREALYALKPQPVRHDVVEQAEDDAAVGDVAVSGVTGIRCELGTAYIVFDAEPHVQSDRIAGAAYETAVGFVIEGHGSASVHSRGKITTIRGTAAVHLPRDRPLVVGSALRFLPNAALIDLAAIRERLAAHVGNTFVPTARMRQAAVAVVLRELSNGTEILFIKRAVKPGDPWSGQMAFPGGHLDSSDSGLKEAAMRETLEEVGLDLEGEAYLGALDHQWAAPRGQRLDMLIAPHVFEIAGDPRFALNYEVDEAVWAPLGPLVRNEVHDTETLSITGTPTVFNGYRLAGGHFVWGLTYRMLKDFFRTLDPDWAEADRE